MTRRFLSNFAAVLLCAALVACEATSSPSAPSEAPAQGGAAAAAPGAPCTATAVSGFSVNLGRDGFYTVHYDAQPGINTFEVVVEKRDERGAFSHEAQLVVQDLASARFRITDGGSVYRASIRAVTACGTFGPTSAWVEFSS